MVSKIGIHGKKNSINSSLEIEEGSKVAGNTSLGKAVEEGPAFHGTDISGGEGINGQKEKENSKDGTKENTGDVKQGAGNFPFNIPGIQNYGKEKSGNNGGEPLKQMTDKDIGPNCHWKSSLNENGKVVTTVSCLGEFKNPEGSKSGMDKAENTPSIEKGGEKPENVSLSGDIGDGKKIVEQSKVNNRHFMIMH